MKIPKKIKAMPWPEPWAGQNPLMHFKVVLNWPVEAGERYLVATYLWNRHPESQTKDRTDFRIIASKKQQTTTIWVKGERSGHRKTLNDILGWRFSPTTCYPEVAPDHEKALLKWLGCSKTMNHGMSELNAWMSETIAVEKLRQADARGEIRDEDVTLCPKELPAGLERFIRNVVLPQDDTLIYKKGNVRGICHICGQPVKAEGGVRFRQYERIHCPCCGTKVTCILYNSEPWKAERVENVATIQLGTDGQTVFIRQWSLLRDQDAKYECIPAWLDEVARYAVRGNKAAKWLQEYKYRDGWSSMAPSKRARYNHWVRADSPAEIYDGQYSLYVPDDFGAIVAGTCLQYCDLNGYINSDYSWKNPIRFLLDWPRYPAIEKYWKAGYRKLVHERIYRGKLTKASRDVIRWNKSTIPESLHFPKRLLKLFAPSEWTPIRVSSVKKLWEHCRAGLITETELCILARNDMNLEDIQVALGHASVKRILDYLDNGRNTRDYRDYLEQCVKLEMNLDDRTVLFPDNLGAAHQQATEALLERARQARELENQERSRAQAAERQGRAADFAKQSEKLRKLCWSHDGLLIRPPVDEEELLAEGQALHHCVGGYAKRFAEGKTVILLIRKADNPDKPFYTLEWDGQSVAQCRTSCNQCYTKNPWVHAFVKAWVARVLKKNKAGLAA